jgi:hypothetical protein
MMIVNRETPQVSGERVAHLTTCSLRSHIRMFVYIYHKFWMHIHMFVCIYYTSEVGKIVLRGVQQVSKNKQ